MELEEYQILIEKLDINAKPRVFNHELWDLILTNLEYCPVICSNSNIQYQIEYFKYHHYEIVDLSLVLLNDGIPCGIFPLFLKKKNGIHSLDSFSKAIIDPLFIKNISIKTIERISKSIFLFLIELKKILDIEKISLSSLFRNKSITKLQRLFLNSNAIVSTDYEMYVDLELPMEEIKSKFRKSYKSLITQSFKIWKVELFDSNNINEVEWVNFKNLHFRVSGRKTRSDETWDLQFWDIKKNHSFYIALKGENEELVGGAYFLITKDEAYYGVAAYRRDLFDKPLGHLVQYTAIQHCKHLNLKWYKLGERPFPQLNFSVSEKELRIADFKEGFSTNIFAISEYSI